MCNVCMEIYILASISPFHSIFIQNVVDFMLAGANGCREILERHWVQDHF